LRSSITMLMAILATIGVGVYAGAFGSANPRCQPASADSVGTLFAPCQALNMAALERPAPAGGLEPLERSPPEQPQNRPPDVASGEHATVGVAGSNRRY
jgi:hypothetical protein